MATAVATKQVQIIARYHIKKNGYVCYRVLSSNGKDQYCTTLNAQGKATGCSCPCTSPKGCYHMNQLQVIEQQRRGITPSAAPAQVTEPVAQPTQNRFATLFIINNARQQQRKQAATEAANQKRAKDAARKAREELAALEAKLEQQAAQQAVAREQALAEQYAREKAEHEAAIQAAMSNIESRLARAGFMR